MNNPTASTTTQPGYEKHITGPDFTAVEAALGGRFKYYLDRKAQQQIILSALRRGPKTTDQLRALGCFQAPTRVFELRAQGYSIHTAFVTAWAADGRPHPRMALYTLNEPDDNWRKADSTTGGT